LTWEGHEFLDNLKNDTLWKKVIARADLDLGVGFGFIALCGCEEICGNRMTDGPNSSSL
jgi:Hypothetical protein (DUF2513)